MVTHVLFDFDGTLINSVDHLYDLVDELIKEKDPALAITEVIRGMYKEGNKKLSLHFFAEYHAI